jgi:hypothetical protein
VIEEVGSDEIDKPTRPRPSFSRKRIPEFPAIRHAAAGFLDRGHRVALDMSLSDNPSQPGPKDNRNNDQTPQAEAEESSPGMAHWSGRHHRYASRMKPLWRSFNGTTQIISRDRVDSFDGPTPRLRNGLAAPATGWIG